MLAVSQTTQMNADRYGLRNDRVVFWETYVDEFRGWVRTESDSLLSSAAICLSADVLFFGYVTMAQGDLCGRSRLPVALGRRLHRYAPLEALALWWGTDSAVRPVRLPCQSSAPSRE